MKKRFEITSYLNLAKACVLVGIISAFLHNTSVAETLQPRVSFQMFYDELLPYGDWISDPVHGYVWVPYVEPGFQPYGTNGHWVMSTYGNTWVSNYNWGWAPFHYGRWYFDDYLGWAWVPGYEWGPAWVNWRTGGDYYGWAPLMPGLHIQVAVNIPTNYWVFVPKRRLISRNVHRYYVPRRNIYTVYNQTTVINNTYVYNNRTYVSGPERRDVERATRRSVPVYQVSNSDRPGRASVSRNTVRVYQPEVRKVANNTRETQPRPTRVLSANEHKANLATRNPASTRSRTAPSNSRTNVTRTTEATRANVGTSTSSRSARTTVPKESVTRTQIPSRTERVVAPRGQRISQPQTRQASSVNRQHPATQQQPTVRPRTQEPQRRTERTAAPSRQSSPVRIQNVSKPEVKTRTSAPSRVSPAKSRERSSGNTSRTNSQSRGSTRGNN